MSEQQIIVRESSAIGETLNITGLLSQVRLVQDVMKQVMREGEHYGVIPGCNKPSLYQSGAEKLAMTFRLRSEFQVEIFPMANDHREVRVKCVLFSIGNGNPCGDGLGTCSTMESKFRYRKADQKCPNCGKDTIIRGKKEYGGGWICFAKRGGCGSKFQDGDPQIENQNMGLVEYPNPADYWHTVELMAAKRAFVSAIRRTTAASDIFTEDIEDMEENAKQAHVSPSATQPTPSPAAKASALQPQSAGAPAD